MKLSVVELKNFYKKRYGTDRVAFRRTQLHSYDWQ